MNYRIFKEVKNNVLTYGIAVDHGNVIDIIVSDISSDIDFVDDIVNKCNKFDVSEMHVKDVVCDFLAET